MSFQPPPIDVFRTLVVVISGCAMFCFGVLVGVGATVAFLDQRPPVDNRPH